MPSPRFDYPHLWWLLTLRVEVDVNPDRMSRAALPRVRERLSDRDLAVLTSLAEHRFLTTGQIQRLHFADHATPLAGIRACVRVLDRLRTQHVVTRLERRIGGLHAGSRAFVWCLDSLGERVVRIGDEPRPKRRPFEPTVLFLEHTLAVAEGRVQVEEAARAGAVEIEHVQTEPTCWREFVGEHGQPAILKPDLALVTASGDFEDHWFLEIDRGTESIRTVLTKCAQYEHYRQSGREQAAHGVFPLVVWSVPSASRRARLVDELARSRELDASLFRIVKPDAVVPLITGASPPPDAPVTPSSASTLERRNP